jgi:hypothetical protein
MKLLVSILFLFTLVATFTDVKAETNTVSSTVVNNTPPTANSPAINIVNSDVCKTSSVGAIQLPYIGASGGTTITDLNCERIKLARSLYSMGMKVAGVSILCQDARVFDAMIMSGTPCPYMSDIGEDALKQWEQNPDKVPQGSTALIKPKPIKQETQEGDIDGLKNFGLMALGLLLIF